MDAQSQVTPSFVPMTSFGQMAAQRRSWIDDVVDVAQKVENAANVLTGKATVAQQQTMFPFPNFGSNSIFGNPLFVAGVVGVAVYFLTKK